MIKLLENVLLGEFAVHSNFIVVVDHIIEFFVSELALRVGSDERREVFFGLLGLSLVS